MRAHARCEWRIVLRVVARARPAHARAATRRRRISGRTGLGLAAAGWLLAQHRSPVPVLIEVAVVAMWAVIDAYRLPSPRKRSTMSALVAPCLRAERWRTVYYARRTTSPVIASAS